MSSQAPILSVVPGAEPVELVAYYDEFDWYYGNCELETKHWFVRNIQPDWRIFDVGANVGIYSVLFSRLTPQGKVTAFEPTDTVQMLYQNLGNAGCTNVEVLQAALGSKTGSIEDGIYRIWGEQPERQVYPFWRLDDYVAHNNIDRLDCIKIDVDSFDFEVLLGARETLRRLKPTVVVELNHALSRRNQSNVKALEWLREQGVTEVLSLDGDNFVAMFDGDVRKSYPLRQEMTVLFANTDDMPSEDSEGASLRIIKSLDPHNAAEIHGDTQVTVLPEGSQIEVVTPAAQWSYATAFTVDDLGLDNDPDLRVLLDIQVQEGRVGVGCLDKDGHYLGPERMLRPGPRKSVVMPITDPARLGQVIIRQVSEEGSPSRLRIFGVKVGRLEGEQIVEARFEISELARRVFEADTSEGEGAAFDPPKGGGSLDIVDTADLKAAFGFGEDYVAPEGAGDHPLAFWKMEVDDAPIFKYVYRNFRPKRHLEFGTWEGFGAVACASSCDAEIWTLNLPDGETTAAGKAMYQSGADGKGVQTDSGEFIGRLYREAGYGDRVHQILADSTQWKPDMPNGFFDTILIDGGHTREVVEADTETALRLIRPGGIIMWHDFCPQEEALQAHVAPRGVVSAIAYNHARWRPSFSRMFWIRPSWILVGIAA